MSPNASTTPAAPELEPDAIQSPESAAPAENTPAPRRLREELRFRRSRKKTNKGARHRGPRGFRPLPPPSRPGPILAPAEGLSLGQELQLLAAAEELKRQHPNLKLSYATRYPGIRTLLARAWFLERVYDLEDPVLSEDDARVEEFAVPDQASAEATQEKLYEILYQAKLARLEQYREAMGRLGKQVPNLEAPDREFTPNWHESHAYLWNLAAALKVEIRMPEEPLPPYASMSPGLQRALHRFLDKAGRCRDLFALYDFSGEADPEGLREGLQAALPDVTLYSLAEVADLAKLAERVLPERNLELALLVAMLDHPRCLLASGPGGDLTRTAWGAGLNSVVSLYHGTEARWDGIYTPNPFMLDCRRFEAEQLPDMLRQATVAVLQRLVEGR